MFLLLNRVFFDMKDVHMDVSYICTKSNQKNSSSMFFNQLSCKTMNFECNNSPKIEYDLFGTQIWYA